MSSQHSSEEHNHHPDYLAHHFKSMDQQTSAGKLGMWIFMGQELLFFSGLFCAYGYMQYMYPDMVADSKRFMDWRLGGINSIVLLVSSLTMSLCVRSARLNQRNSSIRFLALTMLCGIIFLMIKGFEWVTHFHEGLYPGRYFNPLSDLNIVDNTSHVFFSLYYIMTGMHGMHIVVGLGLMVWLMIRSFRNEFNHENYVSLENTSLFWHFVDVVWIFLYPLLYLSK
jgi:cytochrome c oxidase subunit 3